MANLIAQQKCLNQIRTRYFQRIINHKEYWNPEAEGFLRWGYVELTNPLDKQIEGSHYKDFKIQPVEYNYANEMDWFQGETIKYVTRHRLKNGAADLKKAIHILQLYLKLEYNEEYEPK